MRYALTAEQMRIAEEGAVAHDGLTIATLMERAGRALAGEVGLRFPSGPISVVCGPGNNGGDGWVAARVLAAAGREARVIALREPGALRGEAGDAASAAIAAGVPWVCAADAAAMEASLDGSAAIVDAVFGFGLDGPVRDPYAAALEAVTRSAIPVISADVPSGVDSDTGAIHGACVKAVATVTFSALKPGLLIEPGASQAGDVVVVDLGIAPQTLAPAGALEVPDAGDLCSIMPWPRVTDHKGSRGRVALVVGSACYAGAAVLATAGATRLGAGYVHVVTVRAAADLVRHAWPGAIIRAVGADCDVALADVGGVLDAVADADAIVVGPGLTTGDATGRIVMALMSHASAPLVLDADALTMLARADSPPRRDAGPVVLTPHPGEAARLLGVTVSEVQCDRVASAIRLTGPQTTCLLKGPGTIVADASRRAIIRAGSPGLARAGTGDVLAGMIGTLLAQGVAPFDAAVLGAHLHGAAGEHGDAAMTATCLAASDLPRYIPEAVRELAGG